MFRNRHLARAKPQSKVQEHKIIARPVTAEHASSITPEGEALLEHASDVDLATTLMRNRVINPDLYHDDEQVQTEARAAAIPSRTRQYWQQLYRAARSSGDICSMV